MATVGITSSLAETLVGRVTTLSTSTSTISLKKGASSSTTLSSSLRSGARLYGTAIQGLNSLISFTNLSKSSLAELEKITDKMIAGVDKATRSATSEGQRGEINIEFHKLAAKFEEILKSAKVLDNNYLTKGGLKALFEKMGLDADTSSSIAGLFDDFILTQKDDDLASEHNKGRRPVPMPLQKVKTTVTGPLEDPQMTVSQTGLSTSNTGGQPAVGDINGDSSPDFLVPNSATNQISITAGNGDGSFKLPTTVSSGGTGTYALDTADFDSNGSQDIVVTNPTSNTVVLLSGNNDGTFSIARTIALTGAQGVVAADFDKDGQQEFVAASSTGVNYYDNSGSFNFSQTVQFGVAGVTSIETGDINGDTNLDLLFNNGTAPQVAFGNGNGTFKAATTVTALGTNNTATLGDVNGDGRIDLVGSTNTAGSYTQANANSKSMTVSDDGRYVAFQSSADNLISGDSNYTDDIFVRDRTNNTTSLVSVSTAGVHGNGNSSYSVITPDGRYVVYESNSTNLVSGDGNSSSDIFVRDLQLGTTTRASVNSSGNEASGDSVYPSITSDGRYVVFESAAALVASDTNGVDDIYVRDMQTGSTIRASVDGIGTQANGASSYASISGDGRYVAFSSNATNLVPNDTNGVLDAFVHDMVTGATVRISVDNGGTQGNGATYNPQISSDGTLIAMQSAATNLVGGDVNTYDDVFATPNPLKGGAIIGSIMLASTDAGGGQGNYGGGNVWFDNMLHSTSSTGQYITMMSASTNFVTPDVNTYDLFKKNILTGAIERVDQSTGGTQANGDSIVANISASGRYVAFDSYSNNLIAGDTNGNFGDVFVRDTQSGTTDRVNLGAYVAGSVNTNVNVLLSNANGTFALGSQTFDLAPASGAFIAADLNSDGYAELIQQSGVSSSPQLNVYQGNGNGTFKAPATNYTLAGDSTSGASLATGDFNKDGKVDVIADQATSMTAAYVSNSTPSSVTTSTKMVRMSSKEYDSLFSGERNLRRRGDDYKLLVDLKELKHQINKNSANLDKALSLIQQNMDLVRATGLAMLDLSSQITSKDDASSVAVKLGEQIRQRAPAALSAAENLDPITVAMLSYTSST